MLHDTFKSRLTNNLGRLALAGSAVAVCAPLFARKSRNRPAGSVGAHAWLVPTGQAHTEAEWTRNAAVPASESKHG